MTERFLALVNAAEWTEAAGMLLDSPQEIRVDDSVRENVLWRALWSNYGRKSLERARRLAAAYWTHQPHFQPLKRARVAAILGLLQRELGHSGLDYHTEAESIFSSLARRTDFPHDERRKLFEARGQNALGLLVESLGGHGDVPESLALIAGCAKHVGLAAAGKLILSAARYLVDSNRIDALALLPEFDDESDASPGRLEWRVFCGDIEAARQAAAKPDLWQAVSRERERVMVRAAETLDQAGDQLATAAWEDAANEIDLTVAEFRDPKTLDDYLATQNRERARLMPTQRHLERGEPEAALLSLENRRMTLLRHKLLKSLIESGKAGKELNRWARAMASGDSASLPADMLEKLSGKPAWQRTALPPLREVPTAGLESDAVECAWLDAGETTYAILRSAAEPARAIGPLDLSACAAALDHLKSRFDTAASPPPTLADQVALRAVCQSLIKPVLSEFSAKAALTLVPHGRLHGLPWAWLLSEAGDPRIPTILPAAYLRDFMVQPGDLGRLAFIRDRTGSLLMSEGDAACVHAAFSDVIEIEDEGWQAALSGADGVIASTHVILDGQNPLASRLQVSADGGDQWKLQELFERTRHRPLSVAMLAGCASGHWRRWRGDEMVGFVSGLIHAGANVIIVALGPIQDQLAHAYVCEWASATGSALRRHQTTLEALRQRDLSPTAWSRFECYAIH